MTLDLAQFTTVAGAAAFLTLVNQFLKTQTPINSQWIPLVSLVAGVILVEAASVILICLCVNVLFAGLITGIMAGLSAVGIYEAQNALTNPRTP